MLGLKLTRVVVFRYTERQLQNLYSDPDQLRTLILRAANRVFLPKSEENIHTSGVQEDCKTGMALINGSCRKWRKKTENSVPQFSHGFAVLCFIVVELPSSL